jgi:hypothetical protein
MTVGYEQCLREFGEVVINMKLDMHICERGSVKHNEPTHVLKSSAVSSKTFIKGNGETLVVLPI